MLILIIKKIMTQSFNFQNWWAIYRDEKLKNQVLTGKHAPSEFTIKEPLRNNEDFARDLKCAPGSKMNPEKKCNVWRFDSKIDNFIFITPFVCAIESVFSDSFNSSNSTIIPDKRVENILIISSSFDLNSQISYETI